MSLNEALLEVQSKLKAPKSQFNNFGGYSYRNAEDILEAAKPHLKEAGITLTVSDEILQVGDRYYVWATATVRKDGESLSVSAYAREPLNKKGMDESQITGMASSYARKYALNGLFLIDDTKDADAMDNGNKAGEKRDKPWPTDREFIAKCRSCGTRYTVPAGVTEEQFRTAAFCCEHPDWVVE